MAQEQPASASSVSRVIIMGAAGRDFHNFNMVFRDNPNYHVVAFTATQIPGIADKKYPSALAGSLYQDGIEIHSEDQLESLIQTHQVDTVYFSYSDIAHTEVMHKASQVLAAGASFALLGPDQTMLTSSVPVISVCAVRTGAGKSPVSQWITKWLTAQQHRVAVLRHPMPYGDLERQAVQRFAAFDDLDAADATIEEREEYEPYVRMGVPVFAGVDYARILALATEEADVVLWDGGNNDLPFIRPDLHLVVLDPHRAGHETAYHPGEANFRMADAYVITKVDSASKQKMAAVRRAIKAVNPDVPVVTADLEVIMEDPATIADKRVVIAGDGPTLTHGGMGYGAGSLAAEQFGAGEVILPGPYAVGQIRKTFAAFPHLRRELPAMGYSQEQISDLQETLNRVDANVIIDATPVDLSRLVEVNKPIVGVEYRFKERRAGLTRVLQDFSRQHLPSR